MDSEIIDITEINFDNENGGPSNSFGGGIELLMNEKKKIPVKTGIVTTI